MHFLIVAMMPDAIGQTFIFHVQHMGDQDEPAWLMITTMENYLVYVTVYDPYNSVFSETVSLELLFSPLIHNSPIQYMT